MNVPEINMPVLGIRAVRVKVSKNLLAQLIKRDPPVGDNLVNRRAEGGSSLLHHGEAGRGVRRSVFSPSQRAGEAMLSFSLSFSHLNKYNRNEKMITHLNDPKTARDNPLLERF
ncbi:MAG TPA: hypothetical protein VFV38_26350 [Ktedonobacteraceae bacterium]|nr:hypothetical protein [Ktedonobacteraceae bacterium]